MLLYFDSTWLPKLLFLYSLPAILDLEFYLLRILRSSSLFYNLGFYGSALLSSIIVLFCSKSLISCSSFNFSYFKNSNSLLKIFMNSLKIYSFPPSLDFCKGNSFYLYSTMSSTSSLPLSFNYSYFRT